VQEGEDGESETVFVVEDIAAGAELSELAMQCLDAAGRPVPEGTPGKVPTDLFLQHPSSLGFRKGNVGFREGAFLLLSRGRPWWI
jgi:hypothetical protein